MTYGTVRTDALLGQVEAYRRYIEGLREKLRMETASETALTIEATLRRTQRNLQEIKEELGIREWRKEGKKD